MHVEGDGWRRAFHLTDLPMLGLIWVLTDRRPRRRVDHLPDRLFADLISLSPLSRLSGATPE